MSTEADITGHYSSGELLQRLSAVLADDGADPQAPTIAAMAPYDQFHGRGMEATEELAGLLDAAPSDHVLDVGCGIGGPARYMADRFGCKVTGIDLTPEFCDAARHVTGLMGLDGRVDFEQGDATAMPFGDGSFDKAYSMNVSMNIADKAGFYGEIGRVLKTGRAAHSVGDRARTGRRRRLPDAMGADRRVEFPRNAGRDACRPRSLRLHHRAGARHERRGAGIRRAVACAGRCRQEAPASGRPVVSWRPRVGKHGQHVARGRRETAHSH